MRVLALAGFVFMLALAAAGCGGSDEPPAQAWADDVCGRINEWEQQLRDIVAAEGEGSATERVRQKVDQAATATTDLLSDLQGIGAPDTEGGAEAKSEVVALAQSTSDRIDRIRTDAENAQGTSELLQLATNISTEFDAARDEARQTFDRIGDLDPAGELREGIESSEACDQLTS